VTVMSLIMAVMFVSGFTQATHLPSPYPQDGLHKSRLPIAVTDSRESTSFFFFFWFFETGFLCVALAVLELTL
jgi:hypothetical protein